MVLGIPPLGFPDVQTYHKRMDELWESLSEEKKKEILMERYGKEIESGEMTLEEAAKFMRAIRLAFTK